MPGLPLDDREARSLGVWLQRHANLETGMPVPNSLRADNLQEFWRALGATAADPEQRVRAWTQMCQAEYAEEAKILEAKLQNGEADECHSRYKNALLRVQCAEYQLRCIREDILSLNCRTEQLEELLAKSPASTTLNNENRKFVSALVQADHASQDFPEAGVVMTEDSLDANDENAVLFTCLKEAQFNPPHPEAVSSVALLEFCQELMLNATARMEKRAEEYFQDIKLVEEDAFSTNRSEGDLREEYYKKSTAMLRSVQAQKLEHAALSVKATTEMRQIQRWVASRLQIAMNKIRLCPEDDFVELKKQLIELITVNEGKNAALSSLQQRLAQLEKSKAPWIAKKKELKILHKKVLSGRQETEKLKEAAQVALQTLSKHVSRWEDSSKTVMKVIENMKSFDETVHASYKAASGALAEQWTAIRNVQAAHELLKIERLPNTKLSSNLNAEESKVMLQDTNAFSKASGYLLKLQEHVDSSIQHHWPAICPSYFAFVEQCKNDIAALQETKKKLATTLQEAKGTMPNILKDLVNQPSLDTCPAIQVDGKNAREWVDDIYAKLAASKEVFM